MAECRQVHSGCHRVILQMSWWNNMIMKQKSAGEEWMMELHCAEACIAIQKTMQCKVKHKLYSNIEHWPANAQNWRELAEKPVLCSSWSWKWLWYLLYRYYSTNPLRTQQNFYFVAFVMFRGSKPWLWAASALLLHMAQNRLLNHNKQKNAAFWFIYLYAHTWNHRLFRV